MEEEVELIALELVNWSPSAVIASAAKQSIFRQARPGLLRRFAPRNDKVAQ
jgi:hypothetical protein